jgi:hypothetical protein
MLPRLRSQRIRLESSIELRDAGDAGPRAVDDAESDEPLSPEDEKRRRAYADWLASFDKTAA